MTLYVYLTSPQERWGQLCALEQVHFGFRGHWDTVPVFSLTANEQNILAVVHRAVLERLGFAFVIPVEIVDGFLQAELADIGMGTGCVPSLLSVRMKIDLIGREFLSQLLRVDPTAPINAQSAAITRLVRPLYQRMRTWAVRHLGARAMPGGGGETVETQTGTTNATPLLPIPSSSKKPQAAPPSVPLMLQQAAEALQASSSSSFPNPFITNSGNPKPDKPASVRSAPGRVQRSKRSKSSGHNRHANPNANASVVEAAAAILAKHAAAAEEADEEEETDPAAPSAPPMQMLVPLPNTLGGGQQGAQWQEAQQNNHVGIRSQANAMGGTGVGGAFGAQQGQPGNAPNLVPQPQPLAHNGHQNENPTQNGSQLQPTAQPPQPTHPFQQHQMPPHIAPPGFYPNPLHPDNHNHPLPNPTPLPIPNYPVGNPNPLSNPEPLGGIPNLSLLQQLEHPADIFGVTPAAPQHPHPHHLNANGLNPLGVPEQILLGGHHTTHTNHHHLNPPMYPTGDPLAPAGATLTIQEFPPAIHLAGAAPHHHVTAALHPHPLALVLQSLSLPPAQPAPHVAPTATPEVTLEIPDDLAHIVPSVHPLEDMEQLSANMVLPLDLLDQGPAPPPVDTAQQEQPQANNNPNGPPAPAQQNPPTQTQTHAGNAASSSGNAVPSASGAPAAAAAAAAGAGQRQDDLLRCKMRIRLPAFHVPRLAGRNADGVSFINEVQQRAEVRISFSRTTDLNGYKTLTVKAADPIRLNTARRLLLNRVAVWTAMRENGPVKENVRVPRAVVGSLIGMRGRAIGELELQSGASVAVENVHIMPPVPIVPGNTRMRGLTLTGTAEAILRCKVLIEAQIQAHRRGDVGFLGRRGTMTAG